MKTKASLLAAFEHAMRPFAVRVLPPKQVVHLYSRARPSFLQTFSKECPPAYQPSEKLKRVLWGIPFASPLMNAAGMFKNGEAYEVMALQGAGAYMAGTTTDGSWAGNEKEGIVHPFVPYPSSGAASNWLGLPNKGHDAVSKIIRTHQANRYPACPIWCSLMASPDPTKSLPEVRMRGLISGMYAYQQAGADVLEINESCPNTGHGQPDYAQLGQRLKQIKEEFLDQRNWSIPVVVKLSNDLQVEQLPQMLDLLFEHGFDGVNLGNTSTQYDKRKSAIHEHDRRVYEYFTQTFGGGVSGRPLKESSLELCARAVSYIKEGPPSRQFHVIRTGGIESARDLAQSDGEGISLNQWFTGYWDAFAQNGHDVYKTIYEDYLALRS